MSGINWTNVRSNMFKIIVLILSSCLGFGSYFCYDSPAALQTELKTSLNLTQSEFMSLYAWYSWPNVFLCFIGGYLIDILLGRRFGGIFFSLFVVAGQITLALGVKRDSLFIMCLGRLIFGAGGESIAVVGNAYAVEWFSGSMLNLAFGLVLSISRLGATASLNTLQPLYSYLRNHTSHDDLTPTEFDQEILFQTLAIAAVFCVASLTVAVLLAIIDRAAKGRGDTNNQTTCIQADEEDELLLPADDSDETVSFAVSDILNFPVGAWMIFIICVTFYSSIFPLISQGVEFFEKWFNVDPVEARMLNSVVYTMALPMSPLFGFLIDRTKHNVAWVLLSIIIAGSAHGLMACARWFSISPWIPTVMIGTGYSMLACSLWPMISFLVPKQKLGTTYGFMQAIQNLGLALTAMLSGVIVDRGGYMELLMFFITCQILAFVCALVVWKKHGLNCKLDYENSGSQAIESEDEEMDTDNLLNT